jgi:hypothetical protein
LIAQPLSLLFLMLKVRLPSFHFWKAWPSNIGKKIPAENGDNNALAARCQAPRNSLKASSVAA